MYILYIYVYILSYIYHYKYIFQKRGRAKVDNSLLKQQKKNISYLKKYLRQKP